MGLQVRALVASLGVCDGLGRLDSKSVRPIHDRGDTDSLLGPKPSDFIFPPEIRPSRLGM